MAGIARHANVKTSFHPHEHMTSDEIMRRARKDGVFTISWSGKVAHCQLLVDKLKQAGKLKRIFRGKGYDQYKPTGK